MNVYKRDRQTNGQTCKTSNVPHQDGHIINYTVTVTTNKCRKNKENNLFKNVV